MDWPAILGMVIAGIILTFVLGVLAWFRWGLAELWRRLRQKERDELRAKVGKVGLPNREALVAAIAEVQISAVELLIRTREMDQWRKGPVDWSSRPSVAKAIQAEKDARVAYNSALKALERERLVAGYAYREPIDDFVGCLAEQFKKHGQLKPSDSSGLIDIRLGAEEAVRKIDAIVSGQDNSLSQGR